MSSHPQTRLHGLDAVRGGALLLGILFHAAFSFFPGDQVWLVADTQRSAVLSGGAFILHMFRMTVFFLLAGYFARMQTHRLGTGAFIRDRAMRIAAPLAVFWPVMLVSFICVAIFAMQSANGGVMPENPPEQPPLTHETFPLFHLWFLYLLLLFYVAALSLGGVLSLTGLKARLDGITDSVFRRTALWHVLPILLAAPAALLFLGHTDWHP